MKRLITFAFCALMTVSMMGAKKVDSPIVDVRGDLSKYEYVYVIPVSGDKPAPGVQVNNGYVIYSRNLYPSDVISGYLMKFNYTIMPECSLEHAEKTLIVSYGFTGRRLLSWVKSACTVLIQMSDAQTHEIVASFEAEGAGYDEVFAMLEAIYTDLELFKYSASPRVTAELAKNTNKNVKINVTNETPKDIHSVDIRLIYRKNGEIVHEQQTTIGMTLQPRLTSTKTISRDASARGKGYEIDVEVIGYK